MTTSNSMASYLYQELSSAQLLAPKHDFAPYVANIMSTGARELKWARPIVGHFEWWQGMLALGYRNPRITNRHILGYARLLSEYLIAPVHLDTDTHQSIAQLGTLACLIVTYYDAFLDGGRVNENPLPSRMLKAVADPQQRRTLSLPSGTRALPNRIMIRLVCEYFDLLDSLPFAARRRKVYNTILRAIHRMHSCQIATQSIHFGDTQPSSIRSLLHKSIYPIIVMALPAWLASPTLSANDYISHLRWLYRLGTFVAWVDDIIDLEYDRANDQPNAIAGLVSPLDDNTDQYQTLIRKITAEGAAIQQQWDRRAGDRQDLQPIISQVLKIALKTWIGA